MILFLLLNSGFALARDRHYARNPGVEFGLQTFAGIGLSHKVNNFQGDVGFFGNFFFTRAMYFGLNFQSELRYYEENPEIQKIYLQFPELNLGFVLPLSRWLFFDFQVGTNSSYGVAAIVAIVLVTAIIFAGDDKSSINLSGFSADTFNNLNYSRASFSDAGHYHVSPSFKFKAGPGLLSVGYRYKYYLPESRINNSGFAIYENSHAITSAYSFYF